MSPARSSIPPWTGTIAAAGLLLAAGCLLLLVASETWTGRAIALSGLVAGVGLAGWLAGRLPRRAALLAWAILGGVYLLAGVQAGRLPQEGAPWSSVTWGEHPAPAWWRVANVVPESDQLLFGSFLVAPVDRFTDGKKAARLRRLTRGVYRELLASGLAPSASTMPLSYQDLLFGGAGRVGHAWLWLPEGTESLPVVLFLHGSAGGWQAYTWLLGPLAEAEGVAVLAPSYGFGDWFEPGGLEAIDRAWAYIDAHPRLDARQVHLVGLSNGGFGVTRAVLSAPERWASVSYVSPVIDREPELGGALHQAGLVARIISGEDDARIPAGVLRAGVRQIRGRGAAELEMVPGEDHFLFFSQPERVRAFLSDSIH